LKYAAILQEKSMTAKLVHMGKANCALDIGDGSERGEYVGQEYMIQTLGRPHRMVNIMYTYYPKDEQWPARISEAMKDLEVKFQWDYPYDDYCPYNDEGRQFEQMRDIRQHGQDVMLTLTIDCSLEDEELRKVARGLRTFGRIAIRINHECHGSWFTHDKRFTFEEIGAFFVRFNNIIKEEAPNVKTVFCAGRVQTNPQDGIRMMDAVTGDQKIQYEDEFLEAYKACDIVSSDWYLALHYGWPYDIAEANDPEPRYCADGVDEMYEEYKNTYRRLVRIAGKKPFIQAEFNADGDVTGPAMQGESVKRYYNKIKDGNERFIDGISMYQFRDRGRLGLEIESPNDKTVGIKQPLMDDYKTVLFDSYFYPQMEVKDEQEYPVELRWGGSEDADGIEIDLEFEKTPVFCEVTMQEDLSLMMEFHGRWFYKAAGVKTIDLMSAFFDKPLEGKKNLPIRIFATPPTGENPDDGREDWMINYYTKMTKAPEFRIRYEMPGVVR